MPVIRAHLAVCLMLAIGCGGASSTAPVEPIPLPDDEPPAAQPVVRDDEPAPERERTPEELEPIMERWHWSMTSLGEVFAASDGDCELLASNLDAWVIENKPSLTQLATDVASIPDTQWEELVAARAAAEPELLRPLQVGYLACSDHAEFQDVTQRIDALVY